MTEVVTYIRCQINGKWTNLGLIAEEDEIKEHFEYVEDLLKEKQRADKLEKRWSELKESIIHMPCNQVGQISPRYIFDKIKQLEEDGE